MCCFCIALLLSTLVQVVTYSTNVYTFEYTHVHHSICNEMLSLCFNINHISYLKGLGVKWLESSLCLSNPNRSYAMHILIQAWVRPKAKQGEIDRAELSNAPKWLGISSRSVDIAKSTSEQALVTQVSAKVINLAQQRA